MVRVGGQTRDCWWWYWWLDMLGGLGSHGVVR